MASDIIAQIAGTVGVSPQTVLRVLAKGCTDKRPTFVRRASQIQQLAKELNYRPNAAAKAVREGRFNTYGLLMARDPFQGGITQELFEGMHNELDRLGKRLLTFRIGDSKRPEELPRAFRELVCDGIIISYYCQVPEALENELRASGIPAVWLNSERREDAVRPDDEGGSRLLTDYFLRAGHRRIGYADLFLHNARQHNHLHYSKEHRRNGYLAAMKDAGLPPLLLDDRDAPGRADRLAVVQSLLHRPDRPTAMICYGLDWRVVEVAALQMGIRPPTDLAIGAFAPASVAGDVWPYVNAVVPEQEMGEKAVALLERKIQSPTESIPSLILPYTLSDTALRP